MNHEIRYADAINGNFDMSWQEVLATVQENPFSTQPDEPFFFGGNGDSFTIGQILSLLGIPNMAEEVLV